jgi:hypothetical protein
MKFDETVQLELPDTFPADEFDEFVSTGRAVLSADKDLRKEFNLATNIIAWRYRASVEHLDAYLAGSDQTFEEIYIRESHLFSLFSAGVSFIEAACYASYAMASQILTVPFGQKEQREPPKGFLVVLTKSRPNAQITAALAQLLNSNEWNLWVDLRNRMTHRGNLPMRIRGVIGSSTPVPARWPLEFAATSSTADLTQLAVDYLETALFPVLSNGLASVLAGAVGLPSGI